MDSERGAEASDLHQVRSTRRQFLTRAAVAGLLGSSFTGLLAACAPSAPAPKPTEAAKPAAPAAPAPAAPAAKPAEAAKPAAPAAPAAAPAAPKPATPSGPIVVGMFGDGRTLDPPNYVNINERYFLASIFENLIGIDESYNLTPGLAKSWTVSPDGLQITFNLQSGVKFHDGTEFNAEAVKFNFDRVLDANNKLRARATLEDVKSVEVTDPLTVRLVLAQPSTPLLANLTEAVGYISSPTAIKKFGDEYGSNPVGAGPFQLDEWRRDSKLALKRFEGYWRQGLPLAPALTYQPIPDTAVKLTNLKSNAIDIVDEIDTKDADAVSRDNTLTLHALPGSRWPMIRLNCAKPPFDNMALRQAVAHAINKDTLAKGAFFGRAQPAYGAISPLYKSYYDPGIDKIGLAYDPAKAKEKLAAAGMPQGFSFQLDTGGTPDRIRQAELIQNDLAAVGIKMEVRTMDSAAFTDRLRSKQFDAALGSWTPRPDVEGIIHPHFHSKGLSNWVSYNNPKVDELLDKARTAPNGPERIDLYKQVERIVAVEVPWAFLVFEELTRAARAPLQGYKLTPDTLLWLQGVSVPDRR